MGFSVLFVCTANVCRSPTAAALLADRLRSMGVEVETASAGAGSVAFGLARCSVAQRFVTNVGTTLPAGPSLALTADAVDAADLVLTADRRHRGAVVALRPRARARIFTLKEAVALAAGIPLPVTTSGTPLRLHPTAVTPQTMQRVVEELDASRGVVPTPRGEGLDLADAHEGRAAHHTVLRQLSTAVDAVAAALVAHLPG